MELEMHMHNPPHPGETLREDVLPALGLTVTNAAAALGVTRTAFSRIVNERAGISPDMALRLEAWLGVENGGRADLWVAQQAAYDLWQARVHGVPKVARAKVEHAKELACA
jgi:antitoxin HigA-1